MALGRNPLALNPIKMRPQAIKRVSDLIPCGFEEDEVVGALFPRDLSDPPAIVVEGIDLVEVAEPGGHDPGWRHGSDLVVADGLDQGLGVVTLLHEVLVLDHEQVLSRLRDHRGRVVRPHEPRFFAAHFDLVPSAKRHRSISQGRVDQGFWNRVRVLEC